MLRSVARLQGSRLNASHASLAFAAPGRRRAAGSTRAAAAMDKVAFGEGLPGYEAGPKAAPGIIVLQEWWGVTDIIKDQALMLSKEGFRVLVPDLYKGKVGVDAEEASHLMNHLDFKAAVAEMKAAADYLRSTGSSKVGAVGFCMGGALTFAAAQHAGVDCAAPFYGIPDPAICQPDAIKVPVQAHFGKLDALQGFSDPASIAAVYEKMKAAGCDVDLFM
ncbi:MAG: dienelactone hydrolase family-domain-containing protein [Monoraphidium minutum]|nr:MAG: dienelactone hydrolase family-domain-containing protein [Monoraphidium minutum]